MMQFYECEIEVETGRRIFNVRVSPLNYEVTKFRLLLVI